MDLQRLLARGQKSRRPRPKTARTTPSRAPPSAGPQPHPVNSDGRISTAPTASDKKRKRRQSTPPDSADLDFFGDGSRDDDATASASARRRADEAGRVRGPNGAHPDPAPGPSPFAKISVDDRKRLLREHKLKVTWLNPSACSEQERRTHHGTEKSNGERHGEKPTTGGKATKISLFPQPLQSFAELDARYRISSRLAANIEDQGYTRPTEVQLGAIPLLLEQPQDILSSAAGEASAPSCPSIDLLTVAPTGSGKTVAYAVPLIHKILEQKRGRAAGARSSSAVILAPTKELASQIVNECRKLARNTGVKVTQVRKGMKLAAANISCDDEHSADGDRDGAKTEPLVKADILVSTPGSLASIVAECQQGGAAVLPEVQHLVLDEADVLLDPLFREQTLGIWHTLPHVDLRVGLWSATMGSNVEELARSVMAERRERLGAHADDRPLVRLVVGLKDSAVPNIEHRLIYAASEQGKLMGLRQLLHPSTTRADSGPPLLLPFLVFTQTIERAVALHSELLYDIPAEAGGISRIAVLHSDLSDAARDSVMTKFRKGDIWVLITTDLLSRGVDFRGVNGVVNYDMPTSSAAYVHRVGRTGRAGRCGGVAVTLYSQDDLPYIKHVANVVAAAEKQRTASSGEKHGGCAPQQWLLDALPRLSKRARADLKKFGVRSRTARGASQDPRAAPKARISTKAGYVRREENRKKGAIQRSLRRRREGPASEASESDFGGFD